MILNLLSILILVVLIFMQFKIIFHFQKLSNKLLFLYYILFFVMGFSALAITYILAFSGALPNHYSNEFESKFMNDISLFSGLISVLLSISGIFTLLVKQLLFNPKNR